MRDNHQLQNAYSLLKEGRRQESIQILLSILKQNQGDEKALWLFANATENLSHKREILKRLLKQNSQHQGARNLLAKLESESSQNTFAQQKPVTEKTSGNRRTILTAFIVLITTGLMIVFFAYSILPKSYNGVLLIGNAAIETGRSDVTIYPPQEFDGLSRSEIYEQRTEAVYRYPDFVRSGYQPDSRVFGQIEDGKPWWGMVGQWMYGSGERSTDGASEESRYILNPYILASPEFYGLSVYGTGDGYFWRTDANVYTSEFPHNCFINRLTWDAAARQVDTVYDVSSCMTRMDEHTIDSLSLPANGAIDLFAYNARDLDLNYIYVDYDASTNVSKQNPPDEAVAIPHFIHRGGSCGYPGGCNNMSPAFEPLEKILIEAVPASLLVKLWQRNPSDVDSDADMTLIIHFR